MTAHLPRSLTIRPHTLTILGTYRCTAECENCCFDSNPRIRRRLSCAEIVGFIDAAATQVPDLEMVVFSGGECFLLGKDLVTAVRRAAELGLGTRCVTNGYWARTPDAAHRRLWPLLTSGLNEVNISTGDFHQRWVDQETVINAAEASVHLGLRTVVMVELTAHATVTGATLAAHPRMRALLDERQHTGFEIVESPWMPMDPLAAIEQQPGRMLNRSNVHLKTGCKSIFTTLVLTPDHNVGFCCGLSRERIPELNGDPGVEAERLLDLVDEAARDFMKIWLFVDGPERILAWAASKDVDIAWENLYAHHCHACLRVFSDDAVRRVVAKHHRERVDDVLIRYATLLRKQDALHGEVYA